MNIYICTEKTTVDDAPIGLMLHDNGIMLMKTEYHNDAGNPEVYIVESGEYYCGQINKVCVQPIIINY